MQVLTGGNDGGRLNCRYGQTLTSMNGAGHPAATSSGGPGEKRRNRVAMDRHGLWRGEGWYFHPHVAAVASWGGSLSGLEDVGCPGVVLPRDAGGAPAVIPRSNGRAGAPTADNPCGAGKTNDERLERAGKLQAGAKAALETTGSEHAAQ